jgi:hypothetical protein
MRINLVPITKVMNDNLMTSANIWDDTDCYYRIETLAGFPVSVYWKPKDLDGFRKDDTVSQVLTLWEDEYYREVGRWQMAVDTGLHPNMGEWETIETGKILNEDVGGECFTRKETVKTGRWIAAKVRQESAQRTLYKNKKLAGKLVLVKYTNPNQDALTLLKKVQ